MSYAIITFRASGPIKSWAELGAAQAHNFRVKPIAHAADDTPPVLLVGSGDLVADVRQKLAEHSVDPQDRRENGVLAYEAVLTASPAFFREGREAEQKDRLEKWTAAQVIFADRKYGQRVASMVLHTDEETPHVHMVVVPLALVDDKRRKERGWRWNLVGSTISGPGQFDQLQDEYAAAMEPFGLRRGERHSGRKHEPYRVTMAKIIEREKAAENRELLARNAEAAAEQQRLFWEAMRNAAEAERDQGAALRAEAERIKAEAEREHAVVKEEQRATAARLASQTTQIATDRQRLNEREAQLSRFWQEFNEEEVALAADCETVAAAKRQVDEMQAYLAGVMPSARVFADAAAALKGVRVPQAVADVFQAARMLRGAAVAVQTSSSLASQARAVVTSGLLQASHSKR